MVRAALAAGVPFDSHPSSSGVSVVSGALLEGGGRPPESALGAAHAHQHHGPAPIYWGGDRAILFQAVCDIAPGVDCLCLAFDLPWKARADSCSTSLDFRLAHGGT